MTEKSIASLPLSAFFPKGRLPLTWRDGKPILTINGVEHDAEELLRKFAAAIDVLAERRRQVEAEGWTAEHDAGHYTGDLARAAACYAYEATRTDEQRAQDADNAPLNWPWDDAWWKPTTPRRDLVKAGALILAEIDRLDREGIAEAGAPDMSKSLVERLRYEADNMQFNEDWDSMDDGIALMREAAAEIERLSPAAVALAKRPVAFRIVDPVDGIAVIFQEEDLAQMHADRMGVEYQGLYVRDGNSLLHGPFGWLNGCRGLSEDSWTLESDPLEDSEEYFAIPLYATVDPFKEAVNDGPTTAPPDAAMPPYNPSLGAAVNNPPPEARYKPSSDIENASGIAVLRKTIIKLRAEVDELRKQADLATPPVGPVAVTEPREKLTEYELQVLLGTSIHGCHMNPDRVFSLDMAWHRLHAIGFIDRTDGLAIITEKGKAYVRQALEAAPRKGNTPEDAQ